MAGTAEQICAKFTHKTCLVLCSDEFEYQGQKSKVKIIRDKKRALHSQHPPVSTEWNMLIANNVTQAADATILSLLRGDLLACVHRALIMAALRSRCGHYIFAL